MTLFVTASGLGQQQFEAKDAAGQPFVVPDHRYLYRFSSERRNKYLGDGSTFENETTNELVDTKLLARASRSSASFPAAFVKWTGSCKGTGPCALTLSASASATAVFGPLRVPLKRSVTGKGKIACTPVCGATVRGGAALTLRAVPAKGFKFLRWSGACKGTRLTCRAGNRLRAQCSRRVQEALSQSRSSVGLAAVCPASSPRSSPTVLERSASTS